MKKTLISLAVAAAISTMYAVRAATHDVAFDLRMGAGFPGDVDRTHPASIVPGLMNVSVQAPRLFGDPVIIDTATNSYRGFVAGDTAVTVADGIVVRPYPTQQTSGGMLSQFGIGAPAPNQPVDILNDGYIMAKVNSGTPTKNGAVFVWCAASSGAHVQGGFETVASGGNTAALSNLRYDGPPDANGITRVVINRIGA